MIEAKRIPAIPTEYRGIKFRSKLEAKYAKAFDRLGMPWVYEEVNYEFDDGTRYAPDFYFPDPKQFFEVKGLMTPEDKHKILQLVRAGNTVIVGGPDGNLLYFNGTPDGWMEIDDYPLDNVFVAECRECHKRYFVDGSDFYGCPCCGAYDGDHHLAAAFGQFDFFSEVFSE